MVEKTFSVFSCSPELGYVSVLFKCFRRENPSECQTSHCMPNGSYLPFPQWEVNARPLLERLIGDESYSRFKEIIDMPNLDLRKSDMLSGLVKGLHIMIGKRDFEPYICAPNLSENELVNMISLWILHQIVKVRFGLDMNHFQRFVLHRFDDLDDWIKNGLYCNAHLSTIRSHEKEFLEVRKCYYDSVDSGEEFSLAAFVDAIKQVFDIEVEVTECGLSRVSTKI